jgi:taurine dioxygenase
MSVEIIPSGNALGAEVRGIDASGPINATTFAALDAAFNEHSVVWLRGQDLDEVQLIAFASRFGAPEPNYLSHFAHPEFPEIMLVTNIREDDRKIGHDHAGTMWHTDMSYMDRPPRATVLHAIEVPLENGVALGDTEFASASAAYEALPESTKRCIDGLMAVHQVFGRRGNSVKDAQTQEMRRNQPAVMHPLVRVHPRTGRKALYVVKGECQGIVGMPDDEALPLLNELAEAIPQAEFRHTHKWLVGDILMWDNCAVQHIARFDYEWPRHRRLMQRVTVGTAPTH